MVVSNRLSHCLLIRLRDGQVPKATDIFNGVTKEQIKTPKNRVRASSA